MTFAHPYFLLLLLLLPVLAWWRGRRGQQAAFLYSSVDLLKGVADMHRSQAGRLLPLLRWLALALCIVGLARPQRIDTETTQKASGVDIVVALDRSSSMMSEDFKLRGEQVNRLTIAKDVLEKFIRKRPNDRIGLIVFAARPYIAGPLTLDHDFLKRNLERIAIVTDRSEDGTAIGSALATAVNRLRELRSKSKIVILMTDGQNNLGQIPPLTAAEAAQALAVKVYTIGVGTRGLAPVPRGVDWTGRKVYGQMPVDIDEETLQAIAAKTGGKYYRADSTDTLRKIYDEIDRLEKTEVEVKKYVQVTELVHWAVVPGMVLLLLEMLLNHTIWRRLP